MQNKTGLLIIDVQVGLVEYEDPLYEGAQLLEKLKHLLATARAAAKDPTTEYRRVWPDMVRTSPRPRPCGRGSPGEGTGSGRRPGTAHTIGGFMPR